MITEIFALVGASDPEGLGGEESGDAGVVVNLADGRPRSLLAFR